MIRTYFKLAWRSLQKNKLQTFINFLGLTVGTVCCLSILVYVSAQFGYDTHHAESESLYRIRTINKSRNNSSIDSDRATSSPPIAFALKEDLPEVIEACRLVYMGEGSDALLRVAESASGFYEPRGYLADPTVFNLFNFSITEGQPKGALVEPNTVVLSSTLARKLFGSERALNKSLVMGSGEEEVSLRVTGVFDDQTGEKSHLNPNYFMSMNSPGLGEFVQNVQNFAIQNFVHSYIKLAPGADANRVQEKLPAFLMARGKKDLASAGFEKTLLLQKVKDIHLYSSGITNQIEEVSNINYLYVLLILALFIQLVACINFVNLSTARASKRAKEIGVRKVVGAGKASLVGQFLGESLLLSLGASIISIPITALVLPFLNLLITGKVNPTALYDWRIFTALLGLSIITGLLAGIYPALILSSIKPIKVLKSSFSIQSGSGTFRKALVVFQFVVSIGLIVSVIVIIQQLKYTQVKDMGFNKENLIAIRLGTSEASSKYSALKNEISQISGVMEVSGSNHYPSELMLGDLGLHLPQDDPTNQTAVIYNGISENYFETVETPLLAGRNLRAGDSTQVIVNKATIDAFNIKMDNAVGSTLVQTYEGVREDFEIVGVVSDFHFASLKEDIAPLLLFNEEAPNWLLLKADVSNYEQLLADLEQSWEAVNKDTPFTYSFIDKEVEKLYAEEQRLAKVSIVFTCLAVLISCLGLFGLISFMAEQKKKEIGIRKVLGANVSTVVHMLTKDFVKLVLIALTIAAPLAWYFMNQWLQDFTYRIEISWWIFVLAGAVSLVITILTISFQAIKAAIANPVKSLRTE
ncbi:ABC transporter permease [Antarcticibacterium sp. 1MA-6-2]|uniref:ABC transporter permease n=1 Tax=Antarcticibacterium sp. 1MA-6-2 TaxID=2908210 RepID=UPI001F2C1E44|nr:ABC transporter permease [Antarcticibacterium sp. 1MA-6-2]UJH91006.1 ABC transporter permease [Antarcticibacterium sp. 1MA-6-2]